MSRAERTGLTGRSRLLTRLGWPALAVGAALAGCAAPSSGEQPEGAPVLGEGEQRYAWASDWLAVPNGSHLGNTHGELVIDSTGLIHLNTDTERAIMVYRPDGTCLRWWGAEFRDGLHGMTVAPHDGEERLFFVHFNRHEWYMATLEGEVLWRKGCPLESGRYESAEQFRPTSIAVAPDGRIFVADGYGKHWIHAYDAQGNWLSAFGGPEVLSTPHGLCVDTRSESPVLLVADREHGRIVSYSLDGRLLGPIAQAPDVRRPCKIAIQGEWMVVPDLAGRVTVFDGSHRVVAQLGDNPDESLRAVNGVPPEQWQDGLFLAPHSAAWDNQGNLFVMDWNHWGRVNKLLRLR